MRYRSFNTAMLERFGCKVYKLSIESGMSCPNRDGTLDRRGCIFCSGSGEFAVPACGDVSLQLEQAKARVRHKVKDGKYIAYFQSFSNTYAPLPVLRRLFTEALEPAEIVALSIATRPDCLPDETIQLLKTLNKQKPVWVELGLQTIHPDTAVYLRRGYDLPCFDAAVKRLKQAGLEVIVHMILGLPGETRAQMIETASYIGRCGADGIKLHLLHVLEGTDLAIDYRTGRFSLLSLEEYTAVLGDCIRCLPPHVVIHRLTGDGAKSKLVAPLWSGNKKQVLHEIQNAFERDDVRQGDKQPTSVSILTETSVATFNKEEEKI